MTIITDSHLPTTPPIPLLPFYRPSWLDRFFDWVDRLPGPPWLFYLGLWAVLMLIQILTQWITASQEGLMPFHFVVTLTCPYALALMHYQDIMATRSLKRFWPALDCDDEECEFLRYRLTTMRQSMVVVGAIIGFVAGVLFLTVFPLHARLKAFYLANTAASIHYNHAVGMADFIIAVILMAHTINKFRTIRAILRHHTQVSIFDLRPVYAFSRMSAFTAIGLITFVYLWLWGAPVLTSQPVPAAILALLLVAAAVSMVFPLSSAHLTINAEKQRLLIESNRCYNATVAELHRRVDANEMVDMDNLNKTIASLEIELKWLRRVPTWPWQPETAQLVVAALLFPIALWFVQWNLQRMLGG
ncbi:MAG: hypothetical protein HPY64_07845 [Anaerolineae bacterium]|nr:hypothetical protein [Anaerolineae bacterium]